MAWPSTKAGTTHVDAGSDSPSSARADIKQNIDNVNAIIDEFDIASPNNGDILTYNSTSGAWEPGAAASGGINLSVIDIKSGEENVSGNTYRRTVEEKFDSDSISAITGGGYQFTLAAGTYYSEVSPNVHNQSIGSEASFRLYNETDASEEGGYSFGQIATTDGFVLTGNFAFTIASTKTFSVRQTTANTADRNATITIKFYKS